MEQKLLHALVNDGEKIKSLKINESIKAWSNARGK